MNVHHRRRDAASGRGSSWVAESGPIAARNAGIARQRVRHDAAVADAGGKHMRGVDADVVLDVGDGRGDEADVVDAFSRGPAATVPAIGIPGPVQTVRIGDDELGRVSQSVPAVSPFGLRGAAESAVQHDDQRSRCRQSRRLVEPIGAVAVADLDGVDAGSGNETGWWSRLPLRTTCQEKYDKYRANKRCSPAEHSHHGRSGSLENA